MKNTTGIKLLNLALLSIIVALITSGTAKRNMRLQHENAIIGLTAAHEEIARHYALNQVAKLP